MGAVFIDSLDSSSGKSEGDSFLKFWNINTLFLEIGVLANKPGRVKLGSASSIGIAASNYRTLLQYWANLSHELLN